MKRLLCELLAVGLAACGTAGPPPRAAPDRPGCVTDFSAEQDYFPHRVRAEYAELLRNPRSWIFRASNPYHKEQK